MRPFDKPIEKIELCDIEILLQDKVSEGRTLDYKRDLYGNSDSDKKDFLIDISSLANTAGGYLVIGIEEEEGIPKTISGVDIPDYDKLKQHYENLLGMSMDPPVRGVEFHKADLRNNKKILIIKVPQSISKPHAVKFQKYFRFHGRRESGNYPFEVDDIRQAILETETFSMRLSIFRNDRISKISISDTPVPIRKGPLLIFHIIPASAFSHMRYQLKKCDCSSLKTIADGFSGRFNVDGYVIADMPMTQNKSLGYVQIFTSGIIEVVDTGLLRLEAEDQILRDKAIEECLVRCYNEYCAFLGNLGVTPPQWSCLSLLGTKGFWINRNHHSRIDKDRFGLVIDRNEIIIPEVKSESFDVPGEVALKPIFDLLWNACGADRSYNYDENGHWKLTT